MCFTVTWCTLNLYKALKKPYKITKKGRNPEHKPIKGIIINDSFSEKTKLEKNSIEIMTTKINLGIKEEIVNPDKEETSKCFLLGLISSKVTFRSSIKITKPAVKIQKIIFIAVFKLSELISCVIDCNQ